jgi:hypothetical protein
MEKRIRNDLIDAVRSIADAAPSMRIGQLLAAVGEICSELHGRGLWDAEDDELLEALWRFQKDIEATSPAQAQPHNS